MDSSLFGSSYPQLNTSKISPRNIRTAIKLTIKLNIISVMGFIWVNQNHAKERFYKLEAEEINTEFID